jgi:hypothetical protein
MPDGQCSVKGIAFFGTPFEEFATVTQKFKQVRAAHNIEILLYYEGQPVKERTLSSTVGYYHVSPVLFRTSKTEFFPRGHRLISQNTPLVTASSLPHSILTARV